MALTLLELVQRSAVRLGIARPAAALSLASAAQLVEFAREAGEDLLKRHEWQKLRVRLTGVAGAATIALPADFDRFAGPGQGELWDESLDAICAGPLDTFAWDAINVRGITAGNPPYWSLIGNQINIYPTPTQTFSYTYVKNVWICLTVSTTPTLTDWTLDSNTTIFPDDCMRYGIIWRWRQAKGFNYAEDLANAERAVERAISRDRGPRVVNTSHQFHDVPPGWWPGVITP